MSASKLYFAQHGLAVSESVDPERPLSDNGISQSRSVAQQLSSAGIPISQIFHSGKLRANQTADLFASQLNDPFVSATEHLSPNDDVTLLVKNLNTENALYVGHLPHLDKLVSYLVTGQTSPSIITFQNSAVICLEQSENKYFIKWFLTPDLLPADR